MTIKKSIFISIFLIFLSIFSVFATQIYAQQSVQSNKVITKVGDPTDPKPGIGSRGDFVYYCQGNTAWQKSGYACSNLGQAGCGPTSMAMVLSTFKQVVTPPEMAGIFKTNGFDTCGDGSQMEKALQSQWLSNLGFVTDNRMLTSGSVGRILDLEVAKKVLDAGGLIIGSSAVFPCANCSQGVRTVNHIFVIDGVDLATNTVSIRDPNNCSYGDGNDENPNKIVHRVDEFPWLYAYSIKPK